MSRKTVAFLFTAGFILAAGFTVYLFHADKSSASISGFMFLTMVLFGLALGNVIVYALRKRRGE